MKFKKFLPVLGLCLSSLAAIETTIFSSEKQVVEVEGASSYYNDISTTADGTELLSQLKTLNLSKRTNPVPYGSMTSYFSRTDPYPGGGVTAFYSGRRVNKVNREHVWPFSRIKLSYDENTRGVYDIENDIQMIRPAEASENEDRGNSFFGTPTDDNYWDPGALGDETYRGEAARIIFYSMTASRDVDLKLTENTEGILNHSMGRLSYLLEWNLKYPVTSREKTRNEAAQSIQGNRNAFIDNPGYACRIWGNTNDYTKAICSKDPYNHDPSSIVDVTGISIDKEYVVITKNQTANVTATVAPSNANDKYVTWTSSDRFVAWCDNGVVKPVLNNGVTTLTATTHDGGYTASIDVAVVDEIVSAQGVNYDNDVISVQYGQSFSMIPTFTPANTSYKACEFTVSDPSICEIDRFGNITYKNKGTVTVTAKSIDGGFEDSVTLEITSGLASAATIKQAESTINVGETLQLEVVFSPAGSTMPIVWTSTNPGVATIDATGKVTAIAEGRTFITIKDESGKLLNTAVVDVITKKATGVGCKGNIATTSILISTFALLGITLLIIRKRKEA